MPVIHIGSFKCINEDDLGGTAIGPCVWSAGSFHERRKDDGGVRNFTLLPRPPSLWMRVGLPFLRW